MPTICGVRCRSSWPRSCVSRRLPTPGCVSSRAEAPVETLAALDHQHLWHPFTPQREWVEAGEPLIVASADGNELVDLHGRRYLDAVSSLWTNVHGHRHPDLDRALRDQLDK